MIISVDKEKEVFPEGTDYFTIAQKHFGKNGPSPQKGPAVLAEVRGRLRELFHAANDGDEIKFIFADEPLGYETFKRSCTMLFLAAADHVLRRKSTGGGIICHFALDHALFFTFEKYSADDAMADEVKAEMERIRDARLPFAKRSVATWKAGEIFASLGMDDKKKLFCTRLSSQVNIYTLDGYQDYFYGYMVHDTGILGGFDLKVYRGGLALILPDRSNLSVPQPFHPSGKLFDAMREGAKWTEKLGISNVGDLNGQFISAGSRQTILISEALQESRISDIAGEIHGRRDIRFVMIAGPSSSGKTTFAQRLSIELMSRGLRPHYIGIDNYFVNRAESPVLPDGSRDFESLRAIDVAGFKRDMTDLLEGRSVKIPSYDFIKGERFYTGETLCLGENDLLVIEGIHGLNDALTGELPAESRFRIYISALSMLNIDGHNRVPSSDGRLIRRILRDSRTRGYTAEQTLAMWRSVRRGEEENIFPFTDSADVIFNSSLPYELSVLKLYVQPLLFQVRPGTAEYHEARRLLKFLDYFIGVPAEDVPHNSILREFIGGGCFHL